MSDAAIARINIEIPIVENIDQKLFEAVGEIGEHLKMNSWHCGTTHCRGGWYIIFAGDAGQKLEQQLGSENAAKMIYEASTGNIAPDFFASNTVALADIKARCNMVAP